MNSRAAPHRKSPMSRLRLSERCCHAGLVLFLLIDKVSFSGSLQEIEAVVGDPIFLPCLNSDPALQGKVTVFWRYTDGSTVYDIIYGKAWFEQQDESFRGRVESFPDEWTHGNFSIRLNNVKRADTGVFICFFPATGALTTLQLTVKEKADEPRGGYVKTTPALSPRADLRDRADGGRPEDLLIFSVLLLGLALL